MKKLENAELIKKRRQGQGKPSFIYVKYLSTGTSELSTLSTVKENPEVYNLDRSNTNYR